MPSSAVLDLEDFFENGTVGLHLVGKDGTILRANAADYEPLGYSEAEYVGQPITKFHADRSTIEDILRRLSAGEKLDKYPARLKAKDGSIRHVLISSSVCFRDGEFMNTRCFTVDVTDKVAAEEALRDAQERLAATYESVVAGIAEVDSDGRFLRVNESFCRISGYDREALQERTFFEITHPDDVEVDRRLYESQVAGEIDRYQVEKRYVRRDGQIIWVEAISSTVRRADGSFAYGVRMLQDVTERKAGERQKKLLVDELNHRVKNTLAVVQALASQTARSSPTAQEFRKRFEPRLRALSAAHDRLTRQAWSGANLRDIMEEELFAYRDTSGAIAIDGPDIVLTPKASLSLSMAIHELATNAAKYGALSKRGGRLDVSWRTEPSDGPYQKALAIEWKERGGPEVAKPEGAGFGSRLLRVTGKELGGQVELSFDPEGVVCRIEVPLQEA